ncbi:ribonuclease Z [Alkalihalobacillus alcalophilus ATCC 27647 = CGMCC 1.3604]|uniref:Ribonuclease Z n=1 Tax=Alkalihalobacillus alcalophilus ATCC 27647 = CGMCC 1.3604 TaxID=1218173 RepID=A0A094XJY3_ALKAL|nr:ribonuclease Z [Alkalihalobacillus alcalophilus]KGA99090.1 ribonuclease Z [Alkalihalobacillus alcalophilus ATCC 27647 = CGMCC 1.3604]MED1562547.1 ribonuclease Z [Alkalihalobacillus alcalophilus]THG90124.1 ribonuclease Z [Alkalihalobacillus alcalophilus ATCC 27647 = CGMCC 1.3604]
MEFYFLGTGAGIPSTERNVSALALRFLKRRSIQWLFDCGEATQQQILKTPISLSKIEKIFISHLHGDHIFGLPGIIGSRSFQGATSELVIYGPPGLEDFVTQALKVSHTYLKYPIRFVEVTKSGPLFDEDGVKVEVLELDHVMPSFAYKLVEAEKPGELLIDKLKPFAVPPGPIYQQIKKGEQIRLEDGTILNGKDFVGEPKRGRKVVIAGDTRPSEKLVEFAAGADLLIHEATFRSDLREHALQFGHSTIEATALLAKKADVKQLIMTHISSRYAGAEESLLNEANQFFTPTLIAFDQMIYKLT